jgi:TIR domain
MAKLFISYKNTDTKTAQRLEQHLLSKGHHVAVPVAAAVAGNWRTKFSQALVSSDACIVVLSETGLSSKNVLGEIGAARAIDNIKGMSLLPVLVGEMPIPDFINDIYCLRLRTDAEDEFAKVAAQLDKSIQDRRGHLSSSDSTSPGRS